MIGGLRKGLRRRMGASSSEMSGATADSTAAEPAGGGLANVARPSDGESGDRGAMGCLRKGRRMNIGELLSDIFFVMVCNSEYEA
jgi:hypothetical protein